MKKLIAIADWVSDSLSCQELRSVVEGYLKTPDGANISFITSTSSTVHIGFLLSQAIETEERYGRSQETVIIQNTDPRIKSNKGAEFVILKLVSGIFVCGPNTKYNYSLIKDKIDRIYFYKGLNVDSQFRSRDIYARVCAHLMDEMEDELELEQTHVSIIPQLEGDYIGHIDNFGNIKTTIKKDSLKGRYEFGDEIEITINKTKKKALYVSNLFAAWPGELVIYPGSSGPKDNPYLEVTVWQRFTEENPTTGTKVFNNPSAGAEVKVY